MSLLIKFSTTHTFIYQASFLIRFSTTHIYLLHLSFMPLFCEQDSLLQNFLFNAGLPQLMSKSSLLTFEIPLLCLLHIFFPTAFFGWTSWGTKGNMWLKTLQGDSGRWRSEDCTGFVSSTESMIMCTVSHATKKVMVRDMSCYHKKNNLGCIYTYIYPLTFGMFSFHM